MALRISRVSLREASAWSSARVALWLRDNALPAIPEVLTTLQEVRDSNLLNFGPTKIVLSQLSELIVGSPHMRDLLRMRKFDLLDSLLACVGAQIVDPLEIGTPPVSVDDSLAPPPASPVSAAPRPVPETLTSSALSRGAPSRCATTGCNGRPVREFPVCVDCATRACVPLVPQRSSRDTRSSRPPLVRQPPSPGGEIADLEDRLRQLHGRERATPIQAPNDKVDYSDSSDVSADEPSSSDIQASSALLRYRRKLFPPTTTKQAVFEAVLSEIAVARVAFPPVFPTSAPRLNELLSELGKRDLGASDRESAWQDYVSILASFLRKHSYWRSNKGTLRKRLRDLEPVTFNARFNPKAPRLPIPDRLLDGHHISECRAFVSEFQAWDASAESDIIPPASLAFMRRHVGAYVL
jgi:hypothetical protein